MNIANQLAKAHSRLNTDLVVDHVLDNQAKFAELLDVFLTAETKIVQRAAMTLGNLARKRPEWLFPYHSQLIEYADSYHHPAVPRCLLRHFSEIPLSDVAEEDQGPLLDVAFRMAAGPEVPVGIRVFAISIVHNFCEPYPELKDELRGIIELALAEGTTPGFVSRGRKVLRALG